MPERESPGRAVTVTAFALGLAVLAAACGTDDDPTATAGPTTVVQTTAAPTTATPSTAASTTAATTTDGGAVSPAAYLDSVRAVTDDLEAAISELLADRTADGDTADELFETFAASDLTAAVTNAVASAGEIDASEEHADDHQLWLIRLDEAATATDRMSMAIDNRDQVELALGVVDLQLVAGRLAAEAMSSSFCEAVRIDADVDRRGLCVPAGELGDGDWAATTADGARRFFVEVLVRAAGIQPSFESADLVTYLGVVQPEIESVVAEIRAAQEAATPPAERSLDHEELVVFYAGFGDLAGRITEVAEAGDAAALPALFEESGAVNERLVTSLSDEGRRIIQPLFAE